MKHRVVVSSSLFEPVWFDDLTGAFGCSFAAVKSGKLGTDDDESRVTTLKVTLL